MAYGTKTQISNAVSVDSTTRQDPSTTFQVAPNEVVEIQIVATVNAASPLLVFVEKTQDATSETWDNQGQARAIFSATGNRTITMGSTDSAFKARLQYALQTGTTASTVSAFYTKWTP
jgi:hypothetical protein